MNSQRKKDKQRDKEKLISLIDIIDEQHERRVRKEIDKMAHTEIWERIERLEKQQQEINSNQVDNAIERMISAPGFTSNTPLD